MICHLSLEGFHHLNTEEWLLQDLWQTLEEVPQETTIEKGPENSEEALNIEDPLNIEVPLLIIEVQNLEDHHLPQNIEEECLLSIEEGHHPLQIIEEVPLKSTTEDLNQEVFLHQTIEYLNIEALNTECLPQVNIEECNHQEDLHREAKIIIEVENILQNSQFIEEVQVEGNLSQEGQYLHKHNDVIKDIKTLVLHNKELNKHENYIINDKLLILN